jgi:glucosamine--fructose-6-phosphate aminotransferase (isomerizing)
MMTRFETELREQPAALARLLRRRSDVEAVAAEIAAAKPRFVLVAGRGSSDNAARYALYLLGARHRLVVALAAPSLFTRYRAEVDLDRALVLAISQSGQSPDIVAVVEAARRQSALTLALTNEMSSPLANAARFRLPLAAGDETSIAATKTYTCQLLALAMLSAALSADQEEWRQLHEVPDRVHEALSLADRARPLPESFGDSQRMVVIGRGYNYATAFEVALKMKELANVLADPYSPADVLHGPVAMLDERTPLVVVAPAGPVASDSAKLLDVARERGAPTFGISDIPEVLDRVNVPLPIPGGTPEWLSPIIAVVPGQRLALALALARGLEPDAPRGLSKITTTE